MVELMKVLGKIIICMDKVLTHGAMEENTKVNTIWIKNMDMEFTTGQMAGDMKVTGLMVNSMVKENIFFQMALQRSVFGKKVKGYNGQTRLIQAQAHMKT